jgi:hypothetical protein
LSMRSLLHTNPRQTVILRSRLDISCIHCPHYDFRFNFDAVYVGLAKTIHTFVRCISGIFSREITIHTVNYGVHVRSWPPYVYDCIFGDFHDINTVYTPYIHGYGQPYKCACFTVSWALQDLDYQAKGN